LGADADYQVLGFNVTKALTRGADVWSLSLRGGTDFGSEVPVYDQFRAGGLFNFSGYHTNELIGREYGLAVIGYRRRLGWLFETLETAAWIGGTFEIGNVYKRPDGTSARGVLTGGSIYLGANSMLGPVYLAYGLSEGGRSTWYLTIGSSLEVR
jgi:NTE family protein